MEQYTLFVNVKIWKCVEISKIKEITQTGENTINLGELLDLRESVRNGTQLPKGHGRLIILSEDAIKREQMPLSFSCQNWISEVGLSNATVAIIEADKGE